MAHTILAMMSKIGQTWQPPHLVNGKRGAPELKENNIICTDVLPADPELVARQGLQTPIKMMMVYAEGHYDISTGDDFALVGHPKKYSVRGCEKWPAIYSQNGFGYYLLLEEQKIVNA
jgi:hypothetical protein